MSKTEKMTFQQRWALVTQGSNVVKFNVVMRFFWIFLALGWAGYLHVASFETWRVWLALCAVPMTAIEFYILLYCLDRTKFVIVTELVVSLLGMICLALSLLP